MHALAWHFEERDLARLRRLGDVEDLETTLPRRRLRLEHAALVVDEQHVANHLHFVRVGTGRRLELRDDTRVPGVGHVDHRGTNAAFTHVRHEGEAILHVDVHAVAVAVQVGLSDQAHVQSVSLGRHM